MSELQLPAWTRNLLFWLLIGSIIVIPFILFGKQFEEWVELLFKEKNNIRFFIAVLVVALLSLDILLPVPSSFVSTMSGFFLGIWYGTIASLVGMTISALIGYAIGFSLGRRMATKFIGDSELAKMEKFAAKMKEGILVIFRGVPVLAEVSVIFAGITRISFPLFLVLVLLSNFCISLVYSAAGMWSASINSFLLAFLLCILLSFIALLITKIFSSRIDK